MAPNETPYIELESVTRWGMAIFRVSQQRGRWVDTFEATNGWFVEPWGLQDYTACGPNNLRLGRLGHTVGLFKSYDDYCALSKCVREFNIHYANLAKEREEAEKAAEEAKKPQPRRIMDVFELGSETTDTHCGNCPGEKQGHQRQTFHCARFNQNRKRTAELGGERHADCIAAEDRYNQVCEFKDRETRNIQPTIELGEHTTAGRCADCARTQEITQEGVRICGVFGVLGKGFYRHEKCKTLLPYPNRKVNL